MTIMLDPILALNNQGVSSICQGRLDRAATSFRAALRRTSSAIQQAGKEQERPSSTTSSSPTTLQANPVHVQKVMRERRGSETKDHNTLLLHAFAYRAVLPRSHKEQDKAAGSSLRNEQASFLSALVLFNLALTMQLQMRERNVPSKQVQQVYDLSAKCIQRFYQEPEGSSPNGAQGLVLTYVMLAILNNKAHASFQDLDVASTERHLAALKFSISRLPKHVRNNNNSEDFSSLFSSFFHLVMNAGLSGNVARTSPAA